MRIPKVIVVALVGLSIFGVGSLMSDLITFIDDEVIRRQYERGTGIPRPKTFL